MAEAGFNPYIPGARRLEKDDIDDQLDRLETTYWGLIPPEAYPKGRFNHAPIWVEDDSGATPYSVTLSGNLKYAERILVRAMPWSDHPGRGFEALRELMIAEEDKLAVVGVSFPGMGLNSPHMTEKQIESISGDSPSLDLIATQQWQAVLEALEMAVGDEDGLSADELEDELSKYEFVVGGSSQGATNAVSLLKNAPENIRISCLVAIQNPSWANRSLFGFLKDYLPAANKHFKDYVGVNPYNEFENLGPGHNPFLNAVKRPEAHIRTLRFMRRGGDIERIIDAARDSENEDLVVAIAGASQDRVSPPEANALAKEKLIRALGASHIALVNWPGHYHPAMENLANAQYAFRSLAYLS